MDQPPIVKATSLSLASRAHSAPVARMQDSSARELVTGGESVLGMHNPGPSHLKWGNLEGCDPHWCPRFPGGVKLWWPTAVMWFMVPCPFHFSDFTLFCRLLPLTSSHVPWNQFPSQLLKSMSQGPKLRQHYSSYHHFCKMMSADHHENINNGLLFPKNLFCIFTLVSTLYPSSYLIFSTKTWGWNWITTMKWARELEGLGITT